MIRRRQQKLELFSVGVLSCVLSSLVAFAVHAQDNPPSDSSTKIAIIGNSELPAVSASIAWRVPDGGSKQIEDSKPVEMPSTAESVDIKTHKRQVYFDKHLEIDVNRFNKR